MVIEYTTLDSTSEHFDNEFSQYEMSFFEILSKSHPVFYGKDYHKSRIISGKAIIYLAIVDKNLVGISYVKRNNRRGGTAIYPEQFRRHGIAKNLIKLSLIDFPKQYSILSTNLPYSYKMLMLLKKLGFHNAITNKDIQSLVGEEFKLLSNFRTFNGYFVFDRESERRGGLKREFLTLMYIF